MLKKIIIVFISLLTVSLLASCVVEEEQDDSTYSFITSLTVLEKTEDDFLCAVSIEPVGALISQNIDEEDILFEEDLKEATNLKIVTKQDTMLEFTINIPANNQDINNYEIKGIIKLAEGALVSEAGESLSEYAKYGIFTHLDNNYQDSNLYHTNGATLRLRHKGAYVAKFYVTWDEISYWTDFKAPYDLLEDEFYELPYNEKLQYATPVVTKRSWEGNGKSKTAGYDETINVGAGLLGIINMKVRAEVKTGLVWDPWHDICNLSLQGNSGTVEVSGTTLNTNYEYTPSLYYETATRIDELFYISNFEYTKTDHDTILCETSLTVKEKFEDCYFSENVVIDISLIESKTINVNNNEKTKTITFEFEIPFSEWNDERKVYNVRIKEGISNGNEFLSHSHKDLSVVVE